MEADMTALEKDMVEWVLEWSEAADGGSLDADTELTGSGLLDSMGVVGLISYLEDRADVSFDFGTFDPMAGVSVRRIVRHCVR